MNFQARIPFIGWTLRWATWKSGECYWCIGAHVYPYSGPVDAITFHLLAFTILVTKP